MANYRTTHIAWPVEMPLDPFTGYTTCLPRELVPILVGSLEHIAAKDRYGPQSEGLRGLSYIRGLQYMIVQECNAGIDRVYRLLDAALNGTVYTANEVAGETVITPPIPDVPPTNDLGLLQAAYDTRGLVGQGVLNAGVPTNYPISPTIAELLQTLADEATGWTDEEKAAVINGLVNLLAAL